MDQRAVALSEKKRLRALLLGRRDGLPLEQRAAFCRRISSTLLELPEYRRARGVAAYMSIGAEFDTGELVRAALRDGKILVLPRVNRAARCLDLFEVRNLDADLGAGVWGIREPIPERCAAADPSGIDFVLMPGLGFDSAGGRLGYGGGFYDRLVTTLPRTPPRVAAAYAVQMIDTVPMGERDQRVDAIITEEGVHWVHR